MAQEISALASNGGLTVRLSGLDADMTRLRIDEQLANLIRTRKVTTPGSLGFGLDGEFLDAPPVMAGPLFALDLETAVAEWMPMIRIDGIKFRPDEKGNLYIDIEVEWRDGYDRATGQRTSGVVYQQSDA